MNTNVDISTHLFNYKIIFKCPPPAYCVNLSSSFSLFVPHSPPQNFEFDAKQAHSHSHFTLKKSPGSVWNYAIHTLKLLSGVFSERERAKLKKLE